MSEPVLLLVDGDELPVTPFTEEELRAAHEISARIGPGRVEGQPIPAAETAALEELVVASVLRADPNLKRWVVLAFIRRNPWNLVNIIQGIWALTTPDAAAGEA